MKALSAPFGAASTGGGAPRSDRAQHEPSEQDIARWAAAYAEMDADVREGLDELGREVSTGTRGR